MTKAIWFELTYETAYMPIFDNNSSDKTYAGHRHHKKKERQKEQQEEGEEEVTHPAH